MPNHATPNRSCIEDNWEHNNVDQSTNNEIVEAPKRADALVDDAQLGKVLPSNLGDMPPVGELGVNPKA